MRKWYIDLKSAAIAAYGGKCACCGQDQECFLTIDHVNNDGATHRRELRAKLSAGGRGGCDLYQWLRKAGYPQDGTLQVLCYDCNCAKQHDPIGHRKAHPNARFIDGLGEDIELVTKNSRKSQKSIEALDSQQLLWPQEDECQPQTSETATAASVA